MMIGLISLRTGYCSPSLVWKVLLPGAWCFQWSATAVKPGLIPIPGKSHASCQLMQGTHVPSSASTLWRTRTLILASRQRTSLIYWCLHMAMETYAAGSFSIQWIDPMLKELRSTTLSIKEPTAKNNLQLTLRIVDRTSQPFLHLVIPYATHMTPLAQIVTHRGASVTMIDT